MRGSLITRRKFIAVFYLWIIVLDKCLKIIRGSILENRTKLCEQLRINYGIVSKIRPVFKNY